MVDVSVPAPARPGMHFPDSIILYGVKLNDPEDHGQLNAGEDGDAELRIQLYRGGTLQHTNEYSVVLAYGYAFEGRCYRLDTNRVFIVSGPVAEPAVGCGFEPSPLPAPAAPYQMWRIRATTELLEVVTNYGDAKTLILDANLPGKRSPTSYAITMAMAHRDGRLTRDPSM